MLLQERQGQVTIGNGFSILGEAVYLEENGGVTIGVYEEGRESEQRTLGLLEDDRVSDLVPADYRPGSPLSRLLEQAVDDIARRTARG